MHTKKAAIPFVKELFITGAFLFALFLFGGKGLTLSNQNNKTNTHSEFSLRNIHATAPAQLSAKAHLPIIKRFVPLNQFEAYLASHVFSVKPTTPACVWLCRTKALLGGKPYHLFPASGTEPPPAMII